MQSLLTSKYLCYLSVKEVMSLAGICRIIPDIHKCKNDNVFSDQVFVLLMFSNTNRGESEVAKLLSWCAFKRVKQCAGVDKNRQSECVISGNH